MPSNRPLLEVACPPPTALADATFGTTTDKLAWYAVQYRKCRAAQLGGDKP